MSVGSTPLVRIAAESVLAGLDAAGLVPALLEFVVGTTAESTVRADADAFAPPETGCPDRLPSPILEPD